MKKFLMYLGIVSFLAIPAQSAFAWDISYLNPLPYVGIGPNYTKFSLNPFTGFKNCNKCKVQKIKCDECTRVTLNTCPTCTRAFPDVCDTCEQIQPRCSSCMQNNQ